MHYKDLSLSDSYNIPAQTINSVSQLCPLLQYAVLCVKGIDAQKFLQGQLSCDMEQVNTDQTRLAVHCNPKGRIIALMRVCYFADNYYLITHQDIADSLLQSLSKYIVFSKASIENVSDEYGVLGHQTDNNQSFPQSIHQAKLINNALCYCIDEHGYEYLAKHSDLETLFEQLNQNCELISAQTWHYYSMQTGMPYITQQSSEQFTPHQIYQHKLGSLNFEKGCYTGQEVIARMHYKAKLKHDLYSATISSESNVNAMDQINTDQADNQGTVIDVCPLDNNEQFILFTLNKASDVTAIISTQHSDINLLTYNKLFE